MEKLLQKSDNLRADIYGNYLEWKKADSENNTCMLSSAFSLMLSLLLRCRLTHLCRRHVKNQEGKCTNLTLVSSLELAPASSQLILPVLSV